nr:hypothetical protein BaRGS_026578 [Batillaria attramentaria]
MRVAVKTGHNWLLFKRPEITQHGVKDQMDKWHQIRQKLVTTAFSGRPATVFVRQPPLENLSGVLKMPAACLETVNDTQYELYTQDSFEDRQLKGVTDSVDFELSSVWVAGGPVKRDAGDSGHTRESVEAAEKCEMEEALPETSREVCVCVADGSTVIWLNPHAARRESVLGAVRSLVTSWGWSLDDTADGDSA